MPGGRKLRKQLDLQRHWKQLKGRYRNFTGGAKNWFGRVWADLQIEPLKKLTNVVAILGNLAVLVGVLIALHQFNETVRFNSAQLAANSVQSALAQKQLEISSRPYLSIPQAVWFEVRAVSGDTGTQVRLAVQNIGEKPARMVRVEKDFMIRISAARDQEKLARMSTPSEVLNQEQETFWNQYIPYRSDPIKQLTRFFRQEWSGESEKDIERRFNELWKDKGYQCEVYGAVEAYAEPWTLPRGVKEVTLGRSTARPAKAFTEPGGDLLFFFVILRYRGLIKTEADYKLCYVGYFDTSEPWKSAGIFYPLKEFTSWEEPDY